MTLYLSCLLILVIRAVKAQFALSVATFIKNNVKQLFKGPALEYSTAVIQLLPLQMILI